MRKSDFKHDYVIGPLEYLEELKDTARVNYIATLKVESKTFYTGISVLWLDAIQSRSKELGANAFCVEKFTQTDSIVTLTVKVFFAGLRVLEENKSKRDQNNIILFSAYTNMTADSFYFDKVKKNINPKKHLSIPTTLNQEYDLNVNLAATTKVKFTKTKPSKYFIIPAEKTAKVPTRAAKSLSGPNKIGNAIVIGYGYGGIVGAGLGIGITIIVSNTERLNTLMELSYKEGRLMSDIYK